MRKREERREDLGGLKMNSYRGVDVIKTRNYKKLKNQ